MDAAEVVGSIIVSHIYLCVTKLLQQVAVSRHQYSGVVASCSLSHIESTYLSYSNLKIR